MAIDWLRHVDWFNLAVGIDPTFITDFSKFVAHMKIKQGWQHGIAWYGYINACVTHDYFLYFYGSILMPISCDSNA